MTNLVRYTTDDGTEVLFESAESSAVGYRGGEAAVADGGALTSRLRGVAAAAEQISQEMRSRLVPDEVTLEFGVKVSAEAKAWFFAKAQGEGTIKVTLRWAGTSSPGVVEEITEEADDPGEASPG
ncbi:CU044_2847 family protein [Actinoplanes sp. CA-015351]|uniref:CU044_2847 family protein n=1 Tax=Actinoplanes sp. CA-015351 TaxID=3239897 RepID=UPI003D988863